MKPISPNLDTHIQQEATTLATCWKITRTDNTVMGFTSLDIDLLIDSVTYISIAGFTPSSTENNDSLAVPNMDVQGVMETGYITADDLLAGRYDFAEVEIFKVNYKDLTQGRILEQRGRLGEVRLQKDTFVAELRGISQSLQQSFGQLYSPSCRAILGDSKCQVNLASFTFAATVTTVTSTLIFTADALTQAAGFFTEGFIEWTSGNNNGLKKEIKEFANKQVVLAEPMPFLIQASDTFNAIAGCDKTLSTCINTFNNVVNFRGEPHVPGTDAILKTAGTIDKN